MKRIAAISEADLPAASEAQLLSAIDLLQSELDDALKHAQMPSSSPAERQHAIRQSESLHIELALHQRFLALRQQMGDGPVIAERPSGSQNSLNAASQDSLVEELEQMLSSKGTINGEASNAVQPSDSANSTALERLKASGKSLPTLAAASRLTAAVQALAVGGELSSGSGAQDAEIPATAAEQSIPASSNDNERLPAVEWHALRRLSTHLYSTAVQTSVGLPTTLAVSPIVQL
jgi:hypothetical protein